MVQEGRIAKPSSKGSIYGVAGQQILDQSSPGPVSSFDDALQALLKESLLRSVTQSPVGGPQTAPKATKSQTGSSGQVKKDGLRTAPPNPTGQSENKPLEEVNKAQKIVLDRQKAEENQLRINKNKLEGAIQEQQALEASGMFKVGQSPADLMGRPESTLDTRMAGMLPPQLQQAMTNLGQRAPQADSMVPTKFAQPSLTVNPDEPIRTHAEREIARVMGRLSRAQERRVGLGFFDGREKRKLDAEIAYNEKLLDSLRFKDADKKDIALERKELRRLEAEAEGLVRDPHMTAAKIRAATMWGDIPDDLEEYGDRTDELMNFEMAKFSRDYLLLGKTSGNLDDLVTQLADRVSTALDDMTEAEIKTAIRESLKTKVSMLSEEARERTGKGSSKDDRQIALRFSSLTGEMTRLYSIFEKRFLARKEALSRAEKDREKAAKAAAERRAKMLHGSGAPAVIRSLFKGGKL